jgi:Protein of unknown function (DUF1559)
MRPLLTAVLLFAAAALQLPAADPPAFDAAAAAKLVAPFLDEQTIAVARFDLAAIDVDAAANKLATYTGQAADEIAEPRRLARDFQARFTKAGGRELYLVFSIADLPRHGPFVLAPAGAGANAAALKNVLGDLRLDTTDVIGGIAFAGGKDARERLRGLTPAARPDLDAALAAAGGAQAQFVVIPGEDQRRVAAELFPRLPAELGGRPTAGLIHGIRWLALGADVTPKLAVRLTVRAKDEATTKDLSALVSAGLTIARTAPSVRRDVPMVDQLANSLRPQVEGDQLRIVFDEGAAGVAQTAATLAQTAQRRARVAQSANHLKQLALAMHNYNDAHRGKLPAHAIYSKDGKTPLLSWRVAILPFIEQGDLYNQFKLDEPWDSEHNRALIARMPITYLDPLGRAAAEPGKTHYQVFVGGGAPWDRGPNPPSLPRTFVDGTSNTILIAEAGEAVTWTKPDDLTYDPNQPLPKLGADPAVGTVVALADGSVRVIAAKVTEKTLRAAITAAGNETLGPDW